MENIYNMFLNPTNEYRGKPFWSWNGKLEKEELLRQIHVMKEMGFGGFFMHSRTGLQTEYLGKEWFDLINSCADEGEELGLEAWLYDEDRWPSGTAGGMVTIEPSYRMKFLQAEICEGEEFIWSDDIVAAFSCKLEGLNLYEYTVINDKTDLKEYNMLSVIKFKVVEMGKHSFYNGYTYVDTLNKEATEKFIESTHEKYKLNCGEKLGRNIKGIFTDEPHRGAVMNGFGTSNIGLDWAVPWTYSLFDNFKTRFGYDVKDRLPELFLWYKGGKVSEVKWHYVEILQEMFLDNFAKPVNKWCEENNLILTGHILHEDSLTAQTAMSGSMMRFYEHMGFPGVDVLSEWNKSYWIVKQLSSAARQLGQKFLLSELYGCTGWQFNFESHRNVGLWQALFGINLRCHHLSWYTMEGEAKRDYPASIFHQSAWYKDYKFVEDYFSRIGFVMSQGSPVCDTLVINPVESVWCQVYPGWCLNLGANTPEIKKLEEQYSNVFYWLQGSHIDFDYGDEEMLSRLSSIAVQDGITVLKVGQAVYKQILIAGMTTIRSSTVNLLSKFINAGGKVIFAGEVPKYVDAVLSKEAEILSETCENAEFNKIDIIKKCRSNNFDLVEIKNSKRQDAEEIFVQIRQDKKNYYMLMINTNTKEAVEGIEVKFNCNGYVEEWDCSTGARFSCENKVTIDFAKGAEHLFVITPEKDETISSKTNYEINEICEVTGDFEYSLSEPNICVFDMASYCIEDDKWEAEEEILKADRKIRRHFNLPFRSGEMIQPWYAGLKKANIKGKVKLAFEFYIEDMPSTNVELVMEKPEIFKISINEIEVPADSQNGWWIDKCFKRIPLDLGLLRDGKNIIELQVDFHEGINLEAVYLIGEFGVRLDGNKKTIVNLPSKLYAGDITVQGLPFYSGIINYIIEANKKLAPNEKVYIAFDNINAGCIKIISDKKEDKIIAWEPYEADITEEIRESSKVEIEVVLTRRNTFGPLHQVPLLSFNYGPDNFVTEGENFSKKYMLLPSGLTDNPKLIIKK